MEQKKFCAPTVIHGLLEIQKVRDKFKAQGIQLTYAESIKIGELIHRGIIYSGGTPPFAWNSENQTDDIFKGFHLIKNVTRKKTTHYMIRIVIIAKSLPTKNFSKI